MSRADYIALAGAIRHTDIDDSTTAETVVGRLADNVAAVLANANPRFDRATFLAACGVDPATLELTH